MPYFVSKYSLIWYVQSLSSIVRQSGLKDITRRCTVEKSESLLLKTLWT